MAEGGGKVLYIAVMDEEEKAEQANDSAAAAASFRYTRPVLQSTLQLMGCKARHAFKVNTNIHIYIYIYYFFLKIYLRLFWQIVADF